MSLDMTGTAEAVVDCWRPSFWGSRRGEATVDWAPGYPLDCFRDDSGAIPVRWRPEMENPAKSCDLRG